MGLGGAKTCGKGGFKVIIWGGGIFMGGVDPFKHHELKDLTIDKETRPKESSQNLRQVSILKLENTPPT